jgi:6-phosphogluconolactonase
MMSSAKNIKIFKTTDELSESLAKVFIEEGNEKIVKNGRFIVGLSGGSLPKVLGASLKSDHFKDKIDWSKCFFIFADERCTPLDHPDSNYAACSEELFKHVTVPKGNIFPINDSLKTSQEIAQAYQKTLTDNNLLDIDLLLLGMGPDGHTCSLFPNHPLLNEKDLKVASIDDSPKPPPSRVTLTLPVINHHTDHVLFVCTGESKAQVLHQILENPPNPPLPSQLVNPVKGKLTWYLDSPAASLLKN